MPTGSSLRVRMISFDLDGTLVWVPSDGPADWFLQILQELRPAPDTRELDSAYHQAEQRWQETVKPHLGFSTQSFVAWNRMILEELGMNGDLVPMAERIQGFWESPPDQVFADVPEALQTLRRRGIRLGIVSHRPMVGIEHSLRRHGLTHLFEWCTSPDTSGLVHGKLDSALWQPFLKIAGIRSEQALHVGDDFETDVRGARRAGLHAAWIERPELTNRYFPGRLSVSMPSDVPLHERPCARVTDLRRLTELTQFE